MRNIDMSYYRVYYYCNIIDNLLYLFLSGPDWAPTGAQFTEPYFDGEVENFSKYSALHSFCDFAVRQLLFEDAEKDIETIQACIIDPLINKDKALNLPEEMCCENDWNSAFEIVQLAKK